MKRSEFIKSSTLFGLSLAGASAAFGSSLSKPAKAEKTFNLNYAPHAGMFAAHAGDNFIDQIMFMHDQGFRSIEDNGLVKRPLALQEDIGKTGHEHGCIRSR
jgi:hydroxypyruvate isomerase